MYLFLNVCMCIRYDVWVAVLYSSPASLTLVSAAMSAPFSIRREHVGVWPHAAAICKAVQPPYNNRETETDRSGQIR